MVDPQMTQGIYKIQQLLKQYGMEVLEEDFPTLLMFIELTELEIKKFCNIKTVPTELENVVVMRVVGKILDTAINGDKFVSDVGVVKSKTLGDLKIDVSSNGVDLNSKINEFKNYGSDILLSYRRIKW